MPASKLKPEDVEQIVDGANVFELASRFGVSADVIWDWGRRRGVKLESQDRSYASLDYSIPGAVLARRLGISRQRVGQLKARWGRGVESCSIGFWEREEALALGLVRHGVAVDSLAPELRRHILEGLEVDSPKGGVGGPLFSELVEPPARIYVGVGDETLAYDLDETSLKAEVGVSSFWDGKVWIETSFVSETGSVSGETDFAPVKADVAGLTGRGEGMDNAEGTLSDIGSFLGLSEVEVSEIEGRVTAARSISADAEMDAIVDSVPGVSVAEFQDGGEDPEIENSDVVGGWGV